MKGKYVPDVLFSSLSVFPHKISRDLSPNLTVASKDYHHEHAHTRRNTNRSGAVPQCRAYEWS